MLIITIIVGQLNYLIPAYASDESPGHYSYRFFFVQVHRFIIESISGSFCTTEVVVVVEDT